ncbi:Maguk P55 Subfamily Member 2, partial [Manis pentadactyla]
ELKADLTTVAPFEWHSVQGNLHGQNCTHELGNACAQGRLGLDARPLASTRRRLLTAAHWLPHMLVQDKPDHAIVSQNVSSVSLTRWGGADAEA